MGSTKTILLGIIVAILWLIFINNYLNIQTMISAIQNGLMDVNLNTPDNIMEALFAQMIGGIIFPVINTVIGIQIMLPQLLQIGIVFILAVPFSLWFIFELLENLGVILPAWSKVLIVISVFTLLIIVGIYTIISNVMPIIGG